MKPTHSRNHRAVAFAQRTINGEFGEVAGQVLAGLHALDYDSGALAGQIAAEAGIDGVTVGMFGALTDRNYVDYRVEDGKLIELAATVPRPYLRVVELAAGVLEGFRRAGRPRPAFHALGVGTPILLPLLSLLGQGERYFATDSTAPIVDGWSSPTISLYVTEPAPLKYKAYRIADVWLRGGRGWDCECQHCARFHEAHPPELGRAQKWWKAQGKPDIKKEMLERQGPLSAWLPFLGYCADDDLRTKAGLARVGHNHWALRQLELEIRRRSERWPDLLEWVEGIVGAYQQAPGSAAWKAAVSEAFALACSVGERLWQPQPEVPPDRLFDNKVKTEEEQYTEIDENPDRDRSPHDAEPGVASQPPAGFVRHADTVAKTQAEGNQTGARRGPGYSVEMPFDFLVGHEGFMTSHQPSRALLRHALERLSQTETLPRVWEQVQRQAAESVFVSGVPTGAHARLDELDGMDEDALVEVQGRVESLTLEHDPMPPKFSTFVVLRAFDGGATVRLRAHMFSLQKNGLIEGACCEIRGFIRRQQPWLGDAETGLDIDRVSLSELRKASWLDYVAYQMRPFFRIYQDEMNLFNTPGEV